MQMPNDWQQMVYTDAIAVNPRVHLAKGKSYSFLDMASVDTSARCALATELRLFTGGGSRFAPGDTLLARITPCLENGKIARYCGPGKEAHGSTEFIVIRGRDNVTDSGYAYYLTKWEGVCGYAISQMTGTSGRQRVPTESLSNLIVPVPPLPEQRRIAHVLGTLDDKIENNRKTAKTLEAMAQAIFKSWFVDFDPVRAKMNGEARESICKRLKLTPEILDLFPDRLVDSELGEIPEGWEIKPLGNLIELAYGKPLKAENRTHGSVPVYGSNGIIGWHDENLINGPGIVVGRKGNPGTVTWVESDFYPIDTTFYVIPKSWIKLRFLYHALMCHDLTSLGADSAVPGLNRNLAYISQQLMPHANLCIVFENLTEKLFLSSHNLKKQSMDSTEIRDHLLPKLISGEIRVPEAEHLNEEAAG
ncbi:MAG: restriction endonuclease subunit S [Acidithiobacillus sp.]